VGDALLRQVAQRLSGCVRVADTVSRQGGDEFVVLLQDLETPEQAASVARKILDVVAEPYAIEGTHLVVTPSVGISVFPQDGQDIATLLRNADAAMYHAKAAGRNNFQFFTREMNARVRERAAMEARLRRALQSGQGLSLQYQPRIDLATGAVAGMEALLRWHDPDLGAVAPANFIPVAEESGLILPIGEWVLREACRQNRAWQDAGLPVLPVSVNLSAVQCRQAGLEEVVLDALGSASLAADCLELEVTETSIMHDIEAVGGTLEALRARGIRLSIDDFGTGYSSLAYLKRLPLDRLKIDRSFVRDAPHDADDAAITAAIVGMARTLGLRTLAEGIETESQLEFLRRLGCEEAQGFLFSRPLPPDAFVTWVRSNLSARF
jgi:predicted signal transduction protein with EAL and GGDEF domain